MPLWNVRYVCNQDYASFSYYVSILISVNITAKIHMLQNMYFTSQYDVHFQYCNYLNNLINSILGTQFIMCMQQSLICILVVLREMPFCAFTSIFQINRNSGVTRGGRVTHPWKVWGKIFEGRGKEEKGKGEGKGKDSQGKRGKWSRKEGKL